MRNCEVYLTSNPNLPHLRFLLPPKPDRPLPPSSSSVDESASCRPPPLAAANRALKEVHSRIRDKSLQWISRFKIQWKYRQSKGKTKILILKGNHKEHNTFHLGCRGQKMFRRFIMFI
ncbi:hypothetical protein LINPERHAP1_LOCUS38006 [Linum perenne]